MSSFNTILSRFARSVKILEHLVFDSVIVVLVLQTTIKVNFDNDRFHLQKSTYAYGLVNLEKGKLVSGNFWYSRNKTHYLFFWIAGHEYEVF